MRPSPLLQPWSRCSDRRKSFGPSAPIAYATYVSPPDEAVAWPGRRCWIWLLSGPMHRSCKSPRALQKCKLLITRQLAFRAVLGEHKLSSPSTRLKVNHLYIRYLCFESVRGDLQEGNGCASRCQLPLSLVPILTFRAQNWHFCALLLASFSRWWFLGAPSRAQKKSGTKKTVHKENCARRRVCSRRESNPYGHFCPQDFKSCVSTYSTTRAVQI